MTGNMDYPTVLLDAESCSSGDSADSQFEFIDNPNLEPDAMAGQTPQTGHYLASVRLAAERKLGMMYYIAPLDFGWHGDIRKRFTDFIVNEVTRDGWVLRLTDIEDDLDLLQGKVLNTKQEAHAQEKKKKAQEQKVQEQEIEIDDTIPEVDLQILLKMLGETTTNDLLQLHTTIVKSKTPVRGKSVALAVIVDRAERGRLHQEIRRIFSSRFETQVDPNTGLITATPFVPSGKNRQHGPRGQGSNGRARGQGNNNRARTAGNEPRGEYLHFTLYKENKDTMEAMNFIARLLKVKSSAFGFAGTKDRRAATTQRVSVWGQTAQSMKWINARNPSLKIGDFSYHDKPLSLGQHGGNEFVIVIKNVALNRCEDLPSVRLVQMLRESVQTGLDYLIKHGFINYFGLQRFGTHTIGTQDIGKRILRGDFEGAIDGLLHVDTEFVDNSHSEQQLEDLHHRDEISRARALTIWKMTGDAEAALKLLPKRFGAESTIIRHLGRNVECRRDYCGAILQITRGLRNLYIHAYQSYIWNWIASHRWKKYGEEVAKGDLVLVEPEATKNRRPATYMGEEPNQEEEEFYQEARALTAEEAKSGDYSIFDIVLPVPGYDILYPENEVGDYYAELMGREENGGLDPYNMRRRQREFSLSGHYRKFLARFSTVPKFFIRPYTDDAEQLHPTDMDMIRMKKAQKDLERQRNQSGAAKWQTLAANPDEHDKTLAEERRVQRVAESSVANPAKRINDMWTETAVDGSSKRVKMDKHHAVTTIEGGENGQKSASPTDNEGSRVDTGTSSSLGTQGTSAVTWPVPPDWVGHYDHLPFTPTAETYITQGSRGDGLEQNEVPPHIIYWDFQGMGVVVIETTQGYLPNGAPKPPTMMEIKASLETYQRAAEAMLPIEQWQHNKALVQESQARYAAANPVVGSAPPRGPAADRQQSPRFSREPSPQSWDENLFLKEIPEGPADKAVDVTPEYTSISEHQNKLAVVFNFRLSSSNYATIAMRELMGSRYAEMMLAQDRAAAEKAAAERAATDSSAGAPVLVHHTMAPGF